MNDANSGNGVARRGNPERAGRSGWLPDGVALGLAGCAFDLARVTQVPVTRAPLAGGGRRCLLPQDVKAALGTGFPSRVKANTRWRQVGETALGAVCSTKAQVLTAAPEV